MTFSLHGESTVLAVPAGVPAIDTVANAHNANPDVPLAVYRATAVTLVTAPRYLSVI